MGVAKMTAAAFKVFIPEMSDEDLDWIKPDELIRAGEYDCNGIVELLRANKDNPEAIQFIADMMEE